jgi:ribbon-helix-helix CopG family protein
MKRTTISLPDDLAGCVEREAARRRTSVSEVVRTALVDHLGLNKPREMPFIGIFDGDGEYPQAADLEDWLRDHWADDIARDSGLR